MPREADSTGFDFSVLSRVWSRVEAGDGEALHRLRVATRRLREALPLVKGRGRERRRLRRELRRVTRVLGPVRIASGKRRSLPVVGKAPRKVK